MFLSDINYNRKRGDTKSNRVKIITRIETIFAQPRRNPRHHTVDSSSEETVYESGEEVEASGLTKTGPNSLEERLELILETKAGHDGLYDEMLDISKQVLSMNIINQEQLDNFVFNYGKSIMMGNQQQLLAKEVFSPQITKNRRERIIPLNKDETWSTDLIDKSSLKKNTIINISLY